MIFSDRLKQLRNEKGLTQQDLAHILGKATLLDMKLKLTIILM